MLTWAYVFITSRQPKKVLRLVRRVPGVVHADALFGSPDLIAIVAGRDMATMDAVIDRIAEIPLVSGTDSKVARWIDGVELPIPAAPATASMATKRRAKPSRPRGPGRAA
jgi:DNA-binding Lrp family transcriptional regulator